MVAKRSSAKGVQKPSLTREKPIPHHRSRGTPRTAGPAPARAPLPAPCKISARRGHSSEPSQKLNSFSHITKHCAPLRLSLASRTPHGRPDHADAITTSGPPESPHPISIHPPPDGLRRFLVTRRRSPPPQPSAPDDGRFGTRDRRRAVVEGDHGGGDGRGQLQKREIVQPRIGVARMLAAATPPAPPSAVNAMLRSRRCACTCQPPLVVQAVRRRQHPPRRARASRRRTGRVHRMGLHDAEIRVGDPNVDGAGASGGEEEAAGTAAEMVLSRSFGNRRAAHVLIDAERRWTVLRDEVGAAPRKGHVGERHAGRRRVEVGLRARMSARSALHGVGRWPGTAYDGVMTRTARWSRPRRRVEDGGGDASAHRVEWGGARIEQERREWEWADEERHRRGLLRAHLKACAEPERPTLALAPIASAVSAPEGGVRASTPRNSASSQDDRLHRHNFRDASDAVGFTARALRRRAARRLCRPPVARPRRPALAQRDAVGVPLHDDGEPHVVQVGGGAVAHVREERHRRRRLRPRARLPRRGRRPGAAGDGALPGVRGALRERGRVPRLLLRVDERAAGREDQVLPQDGGALHAAPPLGQLPDERLGHRAVVRATAGRDGPRRLLRPLPGALALRDGVPDQRDGRRQGEGGGRGERRDARQGDGRVEAEVRVRRLPVPVRSARVGQAALGPRRGAVLLGALLHAAQADGGTVGAAPLRGLGARVHDGHEDGGLGGDARQRHVGGGRRGAVAEGAAHRVGRDERRALRALLDLGRPSTSPPAVASTLTSSPRRSPPASTTSPPSRSRTPTSTCPR